MRQFCTELEDENGTHHDQLPKYHSLVRALAKWHEENYSKYSKMLKTDLGFRLMNTGLSDAKESLVFSENLTYTLGAKLAYFSVSDTLVKLILSCFSYGPSRTFLTAHGITGVQPGGGPWLRDASNEVWAIDQGLLEKIPLDELDPKTYEDNQTFLFNDGVATLNCSNYLELTMEGPSDSYFTYSLSITRKDDGNSPQNFITIENFPEDTIIYVRGESEIGMYGNVTDAHMDAGRYRMIGCSSITFPMCCKLSQATEDEESRHNLSDGKVQSFQFTNIERQTFEFTVDSSTEFKEIGHIRLVGTAQSEGSVTASVSDMGAYPILLTVSGSVGELSMAGHSFYLTCSQWLRTNMTSILLAIISVIFPAIIAIPSKSDN